MQKLFFRVVENIVCICSCKFHYADNDYMTKHTHDYDKHFNKLVQPKYCGDIIYNRASETVNVLDDTDR